MARNTSKKGRAEVVTLLGSDCVAHQQTQSGGLTSSVWDRKTPFCMILAKVTSGHRLIQFRRVVAAATWAVNHGRWLGGSFRGLGRELRPVGRKQILNDVGRRMAVNACVVKPRARASRNGCPELDLPRRFTKIAGYAPCCLCRTEAGRWRLVGHRVLGRSGTG